MPVGLIREDTRGPFLITNGQRYRPGPLYMPRPLMRHDDGGLAKGDRPRFRRIACAPAIIIVLADGETVWETESCKDALDRQNADAQSAPLANLKTVLGPNVVTKIQRVS